MENDDFFKLDFIRHQKRRKRGHDYRASWKYHVTIAKCLSAPVFSELHVDSLSPGGVGIVLSPLGSVIDGEIRAFHRHHPQIAVLEHVVMPDHVHMLIWVKERMEKPLGNAIGGLKSGISELWRKSTGQKDAVVFEEGFNDKIIYSFRVLDDVRLYIRQNPYRLAVRRHRPDFFRKIREIVVAGRKVQGYGNLFLLRNPFKHVLVVHRADTTAEYERKKEECLYVAANGGIVVSAFIAAREKIIYRELEKTGGRMIRVSERPLADREKPGGREFDMCCSGNLLMVSPLDYQDLPKDRKISRERCIDMNGLAAAICGLTEGER